MLDQEAEVDSGGVFDDGGDADGTLWRCFAAQALPEVFQRGCVLDADGDDLAADAGEFGQGFSARGAVRQVMKFAETEGQIHAVIGEWQVSELAERGIPTLGVGVAGEQG